VTWVLALNAGSSSLKAALRADPDSPPETSVHVERVGTDVDLSGALDRILAELATRPAAVAHRVVHGGPSRFEPAVVDDMLLADLRAAIPLAPLHIPAALEVIDLARRRWPDARHVACFDTGFHHDLPQRSLRLPLPRGIAELGVRRYGFHGLSVQSVLLARPYLANAVIAHLGSGCSVTAIGPDRLPRHTTMSFTPISGMMSATRPGDIDPEILLYLIDEHGFTTQRLREELERHSGLFGVSNGRRDVRDLLAADDADAALALDMFVTSASMAIAACATTLDRWDHLVFTGGVGEHASAVRERIVARQRLGDTAVHVIPADEERVMDRLARRVLASYR
jgi:acetate kinase